MKIKVKLVNGNRSKIIDMDIFNGITPRVLFDRATGQAYVYTVTNSVPVYESQPVAYLTHEPERPANEQ